ncbi:acetylglutamate kinase [bacterium]|nr:acetylglutamate kinase [bacterium]MBU1614566.1 acetylglutamate kinase [bacterium]
MEELIKRAEILIEALPYIKTFYGQTIVIKYGGAAMTDEKPKKSFAQDIVLLRYVGMKPVIVHGGGPHITNLMERVGKKAEFIGGLRVTDEETMELTEMVLSGKVNSEIVSLINRGGAKAVGISGIDGVLIRVSKLKDELGLVGKIDKISPGIIKTLDEAGFIPVVAPIGLGQDEKHYNINADVVACELAISLAASKLIFLTDTKGILKEGSLLSTIKAGQIEDLIKEGTIKEGMIPKAKAASKAIFSGVDKVHILDGRISHVLLLELFTDRGIGTEVVGQ